MSDKESSGAAQALDEIRATLIESLDAILAAFFLHGDRSTAKKATMLLSLLASRQANGGGGGGGSLLHSFGSLLLAKLTSGVANLVRFKSAAAVRFYISLIRQVMWLDAAGAYKLLMAMLGELATGYVYEPTHSLLRTRLNLSSLVFDAKLFDVDLGTFLRLHAPTGHAHHQRTPAGIHHHHGTGLTSSVSTGMNAQLGGGGQQNAQQLQQQQQQGGQQNFGTFSFGTVGFGANAPNLGNLQSWVSRKIYKKGKIFVQKIHVLFTFEFVCS